MDSSVDRLRKGQSLVGSARQAPYYLFGQEPGERRALIDFWRRIVGVGKRRRLEARFCVGCSHQSQSRPGDAIKGNGQQGEGARELGMRKAGAAGGDFTETNLGTKAWGGAATCAQAVPCKLRTLHSTGVC